MSRRNNPNKHFEEWIASLVRENQGNRISNPNCLFCLPSASKYFLIYLSGFKLQFALDSKPDDGKEIWLETMINGSYVEEYFQVSYDQFLKLRDGGFIIKI